MNIKVHGQVRYTGPSDDALTNGKIYHVYGVSDDWVYVVDDRGDLSTCWCSECEVLEKESD